MLGPDHHGATLTNERREHDCELDGVNPMQIKRLNTNVVQPLDRQSRLLAHLADSRILRLFSRLDVTVYRLPGQRTPRVVGTLKRENAPTTLLRTNHEDVDRTDLNLCHARKGTPPMAETRDRVIEIV